MLAGCFRVDEGSNPFGDFVDVHRLHSGWAPRSDHPVDEIREPVRFADDDPCVLAQRRVGQLALQQLRRTSQSAKWILDFVTEPSHQVPGVRDLSEHSLFTGDLTMTIELYQFDEDLRRAPRRRDGRQDAVDDRGLSRVEGDRERAFGQRLLRLEHAIDRVEQFARGHERRERSIASGLHAGIEQRLGGRVHLFDYRAPPEHQYRGRQVIDQLGAWREGVRFANGLRRRGQDSGHGRRMDASRFRARR